MSENSRMARYHSDEEPEPQQAPQTIETYQRRPALARWVAFLILLLTVSAGLKLTVFNANYTAGVVSRSSVGEKVINHVNDDLQNLGVSGAPVTSSLMQPYLAMGVAKLYGETADTSVDTTDLSAAISTQAQAMGVTATAGMTTAIAKQAKKRAQAAFSTSAMSQAAIQVQRAKKINFAVLLGSILLLIVTFFYAFSVHHVFASLGSGMTVGGLLTGLVGVGGYFFLPYVVTSTSKTAANLLTTIGRSGLGVIIFAGVAEIVIGLVVMLGHRTFRKE